MSRELSRLVAKHGGEPRCVPALREAPNAALEATMSVIDELIQAQHDVVVFMTGVAASLLFETAEAGGRRQELLLGLQHSITVARGPKPAAALRGFGVAPTLCAAEPYTSAELLDALSRIPLEGQHVLLFHYGERCATLAATLRARKVSLRECWLYRWGLPLDTMPLQQLVASIVARKVDALAITCQVQFRHLLEVAMRTSQDGPLLDALRTDVVVAAIGATSEAIVRLHGVPVHVVPEQPKMGLLVRSLMHYLERRVDQTSSGLLHFTPPTEGEPN